MEKPPQQKSGSSPLPKGSASLSSLENRRSSVSRSRRLGEVRSPKITGKAKLVRATEIVRVGEDGPMIGAIEKEFEFAPTGAGEAVIEIVKVEPTSPDPTSEKYTVTIE